MRMGIGEYMARVSRWRSHIMGFAMLCILFFHSGVRISEPWNYFFNLLWGVDIFFFCSGLGVHRSLSRNGDALSFYRRRFARIYPAYLPVALAFFVPVLIRELSVGNAMAAVQQLLGNVLMLGWINELYNQFNWYPQAIMLVYLAAPMLYAAVHACNGNGRKLCVLFGFFVVTQPVFFNSNLLILWSRMLYFMMGLIGAELAARDSRMKLNLPTMAVMFLIGNFLMYYGQRFPTELLWGYGLSWYPGLLIVPMVLVLLPWAFALLEKVKWLSWINRLFELLGKWSFEIFLVHLLIFGYISNFGVEVSGNLMWLVIIAVCVALSIPYGKLIARIRKS